MCIRDSVCSLRSLIEIPWRATVGVQVYSGLQYSLQVLCFFSNSTEKKPSINPFSYLCQSKTTSAQTHSQCHTWARKVVWRGKCTFRNEKLTTKSWQREGGGKPLCSLFYFLRYPLELLPPQSDLFQGKNFFGKNFRPFSMNISPGQPPSLRAKKNVADNAYYGDTRVKPLLGTNPPFLPRKNSKHRYASHTRS